MERIFRLAIASGYTGQITANSFMRREFGKKLVEEFLPTIDLTHVIDTAGAFIPGHATPTVILFGRRRSPIGPSIRAVMGIRGEPETPADPSRGKVWSEILRGIELSEFDGRFVTVLDRPRQQFHKHPWSVGGGGAAELKMFLDECGMQVLSDIVIAIGVFGMTNAEAAMLAPLEAFRRRKVEPGVVRAIITGEAVRDWETDAVESSLFPYRDGRLVAISDYPGMGSWLWPVRTSLGSRATFSKLTYFAEGRPWWSWHQVALERLASPLTITFANIASHNHFALDRTNSVFNVTAFVIKCDPDAPETDYLAILGLMNSSVAGFWLKQVAHQKQMTAGDGIRFEVRSKVPYAFSGTQVGEFPIPSTFNEPLFRDQLVKLTNLADNAAAQLSRLTAESVIQLAVSRGTDLRMEWETMRLQRNSVQSRLVWLQEEIDFLVYVMFGLAQKELLSGKLDSTTPMVPGERPFEIIAGESPEGFTVPANVPGEWVPTGQVQHDGKDG
jgi:hypothetical protein